MLCFPKEHDIATLIYVAISPISLGLGPVSALQLNKSVMQTSVVPNILVNPYFYPFYMCSFFINAPKLFPYKLVEDQ